MTSLIIFPIIIIAIISLLIFLFARSLRTMEEKKEEDAIQGHVPRPAQKKRRLQGFFASLKERSQGMLFTIKKRAERQQIKAAIDEAQMHREEENMLPASSSYLSDDEILKGTAQNAPDGAKRLSRMGEIILSYHRGAAESTTADVYQDAQESTLVHIVEENPKNVHAYENLGDYYMERQKFEHARECYKYVLRLDPRHKRAQDAMRKLDRVLGVG